MSRKGKSALPIFGALLLAGCNGEAGSVGIIGGADGPTAVFVTSKMASGASVILPTIVLAVAVVGFFLWRKFRK